MNLIWIKKAREIAINFGRSPSGKWVFNFEVNRYELMKPVDKVGNILAPGIRLELTFGTIRRPIAKFWKREFWSTDNYIKNSVTNPWNSGNHWFVLTIPFAIMPFISLTLNQRKSGKVAGSYIGGRTAIITDIDHRLAAYNEDGSISMFFEGYAWGDKSEDGNVYIEPTLAIRSDMLH